MALLRLVKVTILNYGRMVKNKMQYQTEHQHGKLPHMNYDQKFHSVIYHYLITHKSTPPFIQADQISLLINKLHTKQKQTKKKHILKMLLLFVDGLPVVHQATDLQHP